MHSFTHSFIHLSLQVFLFLIFLFKKTCLGRPVVAPTHGRSKINVGGGGGGDLSRKTQSLTHGVYRPVREDQRLASKQMRGVHGGLWNEQATSELRPG
jgi:hypothetical protein